MFASPDTVIFVQSILVASTFIGLNSDVVNTVMLALVADKFSTLILSTETVVVV
jgi:hypothetical protein